MAIFSHIGAVHLPEGIVGSPDNRNPKFTVIFSADGEIPFPQVILRVQGHEHLINGDLIRTAPATEAGGVDYIADVSAGLFGPGEIEVQVEGCRTADIQHARAADWIKAFARMRLHGTPQRSPSTVTAGPDASQVRLYFGIHKHMHQPYYNTTDPMYWDGEKDGIFGARGGNYTSFIPDAVWQYIDGGLPHAGLSTSWSGSLIEQLDRCARDGLCGGRFAGWNTALRALAGEKTVRGNPRCDFTAFGFFHPLMALIPERNIVRQIAWHRRIIAETFGIDASPVLFPPETAFHVRMIPALAKAGVRAVIYDSIHRFRACRDYPYAGPNEGMLPPNPSEQTNPPAADWMQLHNIWAGSLIAPSLLRPEWVAYVDPDGESHRIIAVPAERYIGNEDARGGFGALQYPSVLGQVYDQIVATGSFDAAHPPFFLLHSDGDNHGGGADSYYRHNTGRLVAWLQEDPRFELITVLDYLDRFPPDETRTVHIEPGSWSGADNGDPQFMKWFSRYNEPYSPDLNSWAVLTAFQNAVHTLEDADPDHPLLAHAIRLMLTAETSCYWYWTGQQVWDQQVTNAANLGWSEIRGAVESLVGLGRDRTPPTIFAPWVTPENPGGKRWGQGGLDDAPREGTVHTFISDVAGIATATLVLRADGGESRLAMDDHGLYPSQTGAALTARYFTAALPVGVGDVRYYIEADDARGNRARSAVERIHLA